MTTTYKVTFDRIGRNHSVAPMVAKAKSPDDLADMIHKYARPHIRSRDYDVDFDLDSGKGHIICGMHDGGRFSISVENA